MIQIEVLIHADVHTCWHHFITPEAIMQWNAASDDWHTTAAENNVMVGGQFNFRMEAKDGQAGFNLTGTYASVNFPHHLLYYLSDGRMVTVDFITEDTHTRVKQSFEPEQLHAADLQQHGWQCILNNYKKWVESHL